MDDGAWLIAVVAGALVVGNILVTNRLWRSPLFETSQKVAQTVLLWLIPGGALLVWHVARDPGSAGSGPGAATEVDVDAGISEAEMVYGHGTSEGHHGGGGDSSGGHHFS